MNYRQKPYRAHILAEIFFAKAALGGVLLFLSLVQFPRAAGGVLLVSIPSTIFQGGRRGRRVMGRSFCIQPFTGYDIFLAILAALNFHTPKETRRKIKQSRSSLSDRSPWGMEG